MKTLPKIKLLFLEDEEDTYTIVVEEFDRKHSAFVEVFPFQWQGIALKLIGETRIQFDLALLDLNVPINKNGNTDDKSFQLALTLMEVAPLCEVVFFTAHPNDEDLIAFCLKYGCSIVPKQGETVPKQGELYVGELDDHVNRVKKIQSNEKTQTVRQFLTDPVVLSNLGAGPEICVRTTNLGPSLAQIMHYIEACYCGLDPTTQRLVQRYFEVKGAECLLGEDSKVALTIKLTSQDDD